MRSLALILCAALAGNALARPVCDKQAAPSKPKPCHRTKYRYIGHERVPWDHDEDDHEWDEFDHTTDECEGPPC